MRIRKPAAGVTTPDWYEIDAKIVEFAETENFIAKAKLITSPPAKGLAERVSQGLGWLTRGRQADDRAERLLYFFTAIEALLSTDDKSAPVMQTISRHAAVLLHSDNARRVKTAVEIRRLYNFRLALVHAGNRSVFWTAANTAQQIAELLFVRVLRDADLTTSRSEFSAALSKASYGLLWPPAAHTAE